MAEDFETDEEEQDERPQHEGQKKEDEKKAIGLGTALLFIITFAVPAYFLLTSDFSFSNFSSRTPSPSPQPSPQFQPPPPGETINNQQLPINTSSWQIYRNDEYGFEVRHPNDWNVRSFASAGVVEVSSDQTGSTFVVIKNNNPENQSLDEWFQEATVVDGRPTAKAAAERVMINGIPAYRLDSGLPPANLLFEIVAIADSQRNIFTIQTQYEVAADEEILEQILSIFRFVENE